MFFSMLLRRCFQSLFLEFMDSNFRPLGLSMDLIEPLECLEKGLIYKGCLPFDLERTMASDSKLSIIFFEPIWRKLLSFLLANSPLFFLILLMGLPYLILSVFCLIIFWKFETSNNELFDFRDSLSLDSLNSSVISSTTIWGYRDTVLSMLTWFSLPNISSFRL